jgi:hypothetical protein
MLFDLSLSSKVLDEFVYDFWSDIPGSDRLIGLSIDQDITCAVAHTQISEKISSFLSSR